MRFQGAVAYEMNPPLVLHDGILVAEHLKERVDKFLARARRAAELVNCVFVTDSVLGKPRLSSIYSAYRIRKLLPKTKIFCSLRTCDHSLPAILSLANEAESLGVNGLLLIKGDAPKYGSVLNKISPSTILTDLRKAGFRRDGSLSFYLSVEPSVSAKILEKKISAEPDGLITQLIDSQEKFREIRRRVKRDDVELVACVMAPSSENEASAKQFGVKLQDSEEDAKKFALGLLRIGDGIVLSSPRSFESGLRMLEILGRRQTASHRQRDAGSRRGAIDE